MNSNHRLTVLATLLIIILFPFGQLTRISLLSSQVNFYWHDVLIGLVVLVNWKEAYPILKKNRHFGGFIIFSLFALILSISILSSLDIFISSLYLLRWSFYLLFLFILISHKDKYLKHRISAYLFISVIISLIACFVQYLFFPQFEPLFAAGWDRHAYRVAGAWLDVNFTGILLVFFSLWLMEK